MDDRGSRGCFSCKLQTAAVGCVLVCMQGQRSLLDAPTPPQLNFGPFLGQLGGLALTRPASSQACEWLVWVVEQPWGSPRALSQLPPYLSHFISVFQFRPLWLQ